MELTNGLDYNAEAGMPTIFLDNNALDFPNDIRFTDNDGTTELDYWLDTQWGTATRRLFWVEVADNQASTPGLLTSVYAYCGKAAVGSASNGTSTFLAFDDFDVDYEIGNVPKPYRGWAVSAGDPITIQANPNGDGLVAKLAESGDVAATFLKMQGMYSEYPIGIHYYLYMDSLYYWQTMRVDTNPAYFTTIQTGGASGAVQWTDGGPYQDFAPVRTMNINQWARIKEYANDDIPGISEFYVQMTAQPYFIYSRTNYGGYRAARGGNEEEWHLFCAGGASPINVYLDDFFVTKTIYHDLFVRSTPPMTPDVDALAATNILSTSATLSGNITDVGIEGNVTERGFDWGLTETYGTSWTEEGDWGTNGTVFSHDITGLTPEMTYHFRAKAKSPVGWGYSLDATFDIDITAPTVSSSPATNVGAYSARLNGILHDDGDDATTVYIYWGNEDGITTTGNWDYEENLGVTSEGAFYVNISSLTADTTYYFRAKAVNDTGTDWADYTLNFPTSTTLGPPTNLVATRGDSQITLSWVKNANAINTLVRRSISAYPTLVTDGTEVYFGTGTGVIDSGRSDTQDYYYSVWSENGGEYSSTYITAYSAATGGPTEDILAYPDELFITDVMVFQNYQVPTDQIIVFRYSVTYSAGNPTQLAPLFFAFEMYDGTTLIAKAPVKSWGHMPGSIYFVPDNTLDVNQSFTIKIIGIASKWTIRPEHAVSVSSENWDSSPTTLTDLDIWVWTEAEIIDAALVITTPTGQVLTDEGCTVFNMGIPGLSSVRADICSSSGGYIPIEETEFTHDYEESLNRDEVLGEYMSDMVDDTADVLHTDSSTSGTLIIILVSLFIAAVVGIVTKDFGFVCAAVVPVLIFGNYAALVPFAATMILVSVVVLYTAKRIWF